MPDFTPPEPEGIDPTEVLADDRMLDDLGGANPGNTTTADGDERLVDALHALRGDVDAVPIPDNDADVLALAAARNLLAALRAAQISGATLMVAPDHFALWVDLLGADTVLAAQSAAPRRVHVWTDGVTADGLQITVNTDCAEITGRPIPRDRSVVEIPAAQLGRLVAPATQGGAR